MGGANKSGNFSSKAFLKSISGSGCLLPLIFFVVTGDPPSKAGSSFEPAEYSLFYVPMPTNHQKDNHILTVSPSTGPLAFRYFQWSGPAQAFCFEENPKFKNKYSSTLSNLSYVSGSWNENDSVSCKSQLILLGYNFILNSSSYEHSLRQKPQDSW